MELSTIYAHFVDNRMWMEFILFCGKTLYLLDLQPPILYNCNDIFHKKKEVYPHENDISAKKETEIQGPWLSCKNEYSGWKKSFSCKKSKRKKEIISIGRVMWPFSLMPSGRKGL